jgi:N-acetylglucosamine kinase-like BadF-type ATPase
LVYPRLSYYDCKGQSTAFPTFGIPVGPDLIVKHDTHLLGLPLFTSKDVYHAVVVIAGTGSVVVSFKERIVQHARVGGRGWMLGSKGGGYNVERETLRQILLVL